MKKPRKHYTAGEKVAMARETCPAMLMLTSSPAPADVVIRFEVYTGAN